MLDVSVFTVQVPLRAWKKPLVTLHARTCTAKPPKMEVRIGYFTYNRVITDQTTEAAMTICEMLPLNCTFVPYSETEFGTAYENGTGTGLVGAVHRGEIDTFEPYFTPTYNRVRIIDFSQAYFYSDMVLATRAPREYAVEPINLGILFALKWDVWVCFAALMVIVPAFATFCGEKVLDLIDSRTDPQPEGPSTNNSSSHWLHRVFSQIFSALSHEHDPRLLQVHSIRTVLVPWLLSVMVLSSVYTSMLFSQKLKEPESLPFRNLETFVKCLEAKQCRMITYALSSTQVQSFISSESDQGRRIRETVKERPVIIKPIETIIDHILAESKQFLVWIIDKALFDRFAGRDRDCKFYIVNTFETEPWTFPIRKKSPLKKYLNQGAAMFRECGIARAIAKRHQNDWSVCDPSFKEAARLSHFGWSVTAAILIIYAIGATAGLVVLFVEVSIGKCRCYQYRLTDM